MEVKVISYTFDTFNGKDSFVDLTKESDKLTKNGLTFGGREAGICYMAENYFSDKINNSEAALKRATTIEKSGHHSPFDHFYVGLEISGIPKMLAMVLNSIEFYTTSEKSARYTLMKPESQVECDIYDKWHNIFKDLIAEYLPDRTAKEVDKLALENARYMISVFTPTSMGYTTSLRQYIYLMQWFDELSENLKSRKNKFNEKLNEAVIEFNKELKKIFGDTTGLTDNKSGRFQFLVSQYGRLPIPDTEIFSGVYQTNYLASFAQLAQAHRHRTIHYEMEFDGTPGIYGCYVPEIIRNTKYADEWIKDFETIKDCYPQCTLVKVLEQGTAHNFFLKCKERLCGRAQLEIMRQTEETMNRFLEAYVAGHLTGDVAEELGDCTNDFRYVCAKCQFRGFKCTEGCSWGPSGALIRKV